MWTLFLTEKELSLCVLSSWGLYRGYVKFSEFSQIGRTTDIFDWGTESGFQTL